jgi:hypothetical protein
MSRTTEPFRIVTAVSTSRAKCGGVVHLGDRKDVAGLVGWHVPAAAPRTHQRAMRPTPACANELVCTFSTGTSTTPSILNRRHQSSARRGEYSAIADHVAQFGIFAHSSRLSFWTSAICADVMRFRQYHYHSTHRHDLALTASVTPSLLQRQQTHDCHRTCP